MTDPIDMPIRIRDEVAVIHEVAAQAQAMVDDAATSLDLPSDLDQCLQHLSQVSGVFVSTYVTGANDEVRALVDFHDDLTGFRFEAWMHEKATRMSEASETASSLWIDVVDAVAAGSATWPDHLAQLDGTDNDRCVHRYESLRSGLHECERLAAVIFEMLGIRLTATTPGPERAGRPN